MIERIEYGESRNQNEQALIKEKFNKVFENICIQNVSLRAIGYCSAYELSNNKKLVVVDQCFMKPC